MKASLDEIHSEISQIVSRDKDGITKTSLSDIQEISEKDWPTLKAKLYSGEVKVSEMTISPISFKVFAAEIDNTGFMLFNTLAVVMPAVAVALALIYSWWFILLTIGSIFLVKTAKSFYRTVIFQAVTASEIAFCFLFSRNTILLTQDGQLVYRKNG